MVNLRIQKRYVCVRGVVFVGKARGEARRGGRQDRMGRWRERDVGEEMRWDEGCMKEIEKRGVDGKTRRGEAKAKDGSRNLSNWIDHDHGDEQEEMDYSTAPPYDETINCSMIQSTARRYNMPGKDQLQSK
jgi:hypothetical protein